MKRKMTNFKSGQALVVLIVFAAIATIVISSAVVVAVVNMRLASDVTLSEQAYFAAEAGANETLLAILRNPSYSGGSLSIGDGAATVTVSGSSSKTIVSTATVGSFVRKIQVQGTYANNAFAISSWKEIN